MKLFNANWTDDENVNEDADEYDYDDICVKRNRKEY